MKYLVPIDMTGNAITGLPDAVAAQSPVTLAQLQAAVQGYSWKQPVKAASTANLTLSGTQTVDGIALVAGDRVLVKNQTTASINGIYVVSAGTWPRATDLDTSAEALGAAVFVSEGTTQADQTYLQTANAPITIGTTSLTFVQTGAGSGSATAGNGILVNGSQVSVDPTVVARKYSANIGDGTATTLTVTHNLGTQDVHVSLRQVSDNAFVIADVVANGVNTVQITFATPPTAGQYRATVIG